MLSLAIRVLPCRSVAREAFNHGLRLARAGGFVALNSWFTSSFRGRLFSSLFFALQ